MKTKLLINAMLLCAASVSAYADEIAGNVEARVNGQIVNFPSLKTDVSADVKGDLATVTIIQTFANPLDTPVHATYLFPMNKDAAVFEMTMEVGDEIVSAKIKRIEEARKTFEKAKREGKSAALLTQRRPNMFTQDIANLMPGLPIKVTMRYVQTVPKIDGDYELIIPLVVGPRFQPPGPDAVGGVPRFDDQSAQLSPTGADSKAEFGVWEMQQLPAYPPVAGLELPDSVTDDRVSLHIELDGGMPLSGLESPTHDISAQGRDYQRQTIDLADGRVQDNRDFVLRYRLSGESHQAGLLTYADEDGGYFSLLIEPPAEPALSDITPREMVFVLDCSGSMGGLPMDASKAFMRQALRGLRPTDSFRIIRFSDSATEFSTQPLVATAENIRRGIAYTDQLRGSGGTMMSSGISQALKVPVPEGSVRLVSLLTDGYIGNDFQILQMLDEYLGDTRLYAFGVGTSVNRFLLSEMGRIGRGFTRYMDPTEKVEAVATELSNRLQSPVLTDISVDWGDLMPEEVMPSMIPDLFAGQSIRLQGRYAKAGDYEITINGMINGREASMPLLVTMPERTDTGEAIPLVWARSAVKNSMHQLITPKNLRENNLEDTEIKENIIKLGLDYSLVTQWTAFVAVTEKIYNSTPDGTPNRPVPVSKVKGVGAGAYGKAAAAPVFAGSATPEPGVWLGMLMMSSLLGGFFMRRKRNVAECAA